MSQIPTSTHNDASSLSLLPSCLRSRPESTRRNSSFSVSFPDEERKLITGFLEPANPWEYAENVSREELISSYMASCAKHGTNPLPVVVEQLKIVDIEAGRHDCFDLKGAPLAALACESLEEILKRVQFKNINLELTALDDEGSVALFDMIEYYESATHLNISGNKDIAVRGWQACSRMIKKTRCLEQLEARNVTLNEQYMPILSRALKLGTQLQVLKLENCSLSGRPVIILAAALKLNTGLKELYLADNSLNFTDAAQLGAVLKSNQTLQLLDVSNNQIQDKGVGFILDGLIEQVPLTGVTSSNGLCVLIVWNNHLTRNAAKHFARALAHSTSLEILNVGHNVLTNECLHVVKDSLQQNRSLLRLGMQSTHLTCEGAIALAECIADNPVIQRIDLRDNNLQVAGLMALSLSMKVNRSVSQLDLDYTPKKKLENADALKQYQSLVTEIRGYCERNEQAEFSEEEPSTPEDTESVSERSLRVPSSMASRKISLTCETLMRSADTESANSQFLEPKRVSGGRLRSPAPSPVPSPVSSPIPSPSRNRFQVSRVSETHPVGSPSSCSSSPYTPPSISPSPTRFFASPTTSRFRVTLVEPSNSVSSPIVSSPSGNNVTVGFTFKLNDKNIGPKITQEVEKPEENSSSVSKLSESLAIMEIEEHKNAEQPVEKELSQAIQDSNNSLSTSLTSLDESTDSADLEVRRILNIQDNHKINSTIESETVKALEEIKEEVDSLQKLPISPCESTNFNCDKSVSSEVCDKEENKEDGGNIQSCQPIGNPCSQKIFHLNSENPVPTLVPNEISENPLVISKNSKCVNSRQRKISWIAPSNPVQEQKAPSGLEKLLGLFQHPASFFSKSQPQYKATTVIVNQQPVANSNASFLLTAGPLAEAALEARIHGPKVPSPDPLDEDKKDHPVVDILNNNSSDSGSSSDGSSESSSGGSSSSSSNCSESSSSSISKNSQSLNDGNRSMCSQCTVGEKECVRTRTEDENFNVSKHSSTNDLGVSTGDKLWCATLSSVCGASVVMSWAHSSSPNSERCEVVNEEAKPCEKVLKESPVCILSKENGEKSSNTNRLYSSVLKSSPTNSVNVSNNSCSLWSSARETKESCASVMPVTDVRLVGGADPCPDDERSVKMIDSKNVLMPQDIEAKDQLKFMMAEDSDQVASKSGEA